MTTFFRLLVTVFPVIFAVVFLLVLSVFIWTFVSAAKEKKQNVNSPRLTVGASVCSKRTHVSGMSNTATSTRYYVTFEFDSGDRLELRVPTSEYGLLSEGNVGMLTFRGTEYISFERS